MLIGLSGLVAGSVYSFGVPSWLLPFTLLPLIHLLINNLVPKAKDFRATAIPTLTFFVPFHIVVLSWFLDADTGGLVTISNGMTLVASVISLLIMAVVLTVTMLPLAWLAYRLKSIIHRQTSWLWMIALPAFWVCCEWLRSIGFSVFLYGPGATIGDYWNFGALGLAAMNGPLAPLSRLVGMYGLSFLTVMVALLFYKLVTQKKYLHFAVFIALLVTTNLIATKLYSHDGPKKHASVLQEKTVILESNSEISIQNAYETKKDIIVIPEYSRAYKPGFEAFSHEFIDDRLSENGVSVVVSDGGKSPWYGTIEFRDHTGNKIETQTKELLIPTGEYMPHVLTTFYNVTGQRHILKDFNRLREVQKGDPPRVFLGKDLTIAPVACSGILGRDIFRKLTHDGADVLTNSASLFDFNHSQSYFRQSLQMARFHAVANSRTYIQASGGAPSFALRPDGHFIVEPVRDEAKFIDFEFLKSTDKTLYTIVGEWPLQLSALFLIGFLIVASRKPAKKVASVTYLC